MGGDTHTSTSTPLISPPSDEESSIDQDSGSLSMGFSFNPRDFGVEEVDGADDGGYRLLPEEEELDGVAGRVFASPLEIDAKEMNKRRDYAEILRSYDQIHVRSEALEDAKMKILGYTPGRWNENAGARNHGSSNIPETTTLLLVGPKGSGKSSLVNRMSQVFEMDKLVSERAQVSCNSSVADGTYFLQEYMITRSAASFCVYDTRGLSHDISDNIDMLKHWMTKGVRNGNLIIRPSDSPSFKTRMKSKVRKNGGWPKEERMVNFVIFVVNALDLLKAMESNSEEGKRYTQMIATTFNSPYLSFKDDKPVVAVTHGDLISVADRARIRVHLGDLLGISATKQIFDIPERCDSATEFAIVNMLVYALEHAEKHLPRSYKDSALRKIHVPALLTCLCLVMLIGIPLFSVYMQHTCMVKRSTGENHSATDSSDSTSSVAFNHSSSDKASEDPTSHRESKHPTSQKSSKRSSSHKLSEDQWTKKKTEHLSRRKSRGRIDWASTRHLWLGENM